MLYSICKYIKTMSFSDLLRKRNPALYISESVPAQNVQIPIANPYVNPPTVPYVNPPTVPVLQPQQAPTPVQQPQVDMVQNLQANVDRFLPVIEQITGLSRREIFLHILKTGMRGGGVDSLINGLLGQQKPNTDAKFVRYVKTLAIWVPVSVGLFIVMVVLPLVLIRHYLGGLL